MQEYLFGSELIEDYMNKKMNILHAIMFRYLTWITKGQY
jgi:hypothetical protein